MRFLRHLCSSSDKWLLRAPPVFCRSVSSGIVLLKIEIHSPRGFLLGLTNSYYQEEFLTVIDLLLSPYSVSLLVGFNSKEIRLRETCHFQAVLLLKGPNCIVDILVKQFQRSDDDDGVTPGDWKG